MVLLSIAAEDDRCMDRDRFQAPADGTRKKIWASRRGRFACVVVCCGRLLLLQPSG
jgi:hypothetical protein